MDNETKREVLVWLRGGKYRLEILKMLERGYLLSSEIAENLKTHRSSTSRILGKLKDYGLIESIPTKSRTIGYDITEKGEEILKYINKQGS